jgi:AraC family transcriptional regulator of adaptative response/methylated-DNA-[protein]-cysteine methyltransferase
MNNEERWNAVRQRQQRADGMFYYAVHTTGVYCRPSCAAPLPRRENVRFFAQTAAAERERKGALLSRELWSRESDARQ